MGTGPILWQPIYAVNMGTVLSPSFAQALLGCVENLPSTVSDSKNQQLC